MAGQVEKKLAELKLALPAATTPIANYVPTVRTGNLLVCSGQLPMGPSGLAYKGKVGGEVSPEDGAAAARLALLNVLAQAKAALGDLDKIRRCVRLGGFINGAPGFTALPAVMNGASDLIVAVLGDAGRHARTTIGVGELPLGAAVEVEALFEVA
jgi:enamine deaminase RidA (YjgF/YER057c/UK114 family)